MKLNLAKKNKTTFIAPGVVERKGNYIVCPECGNNRSFLLTENETGKQIKWRCPQCREHLGGIIQEDGTVEKTTANLERKWILIEIDADCEPAVLTTFRPQTIEEATRRTLDCETPKIFSVPESFHLEECKSDADINPHGFQQFKGALK